MSDKLEAYKRAHAQRVGERAAAAMTEREIAIALARVRVARRGSCPHPNSLCSKNYIGGSGEIDIINIRCAVCGHHWGQLCCAPLPSSRREPAPTSE